MADKTRPLHDSPMKPIYLLTALAIQLTGCSTTPVSLSASRSVPADRTLGFQAPSANSGTISIVRDEGHTGSACYLGLFINGVLAARLDVAESARFYVEPGEVLLKVTWDPNGRGLCAFGQSDYTQRETLLKPNERKQFRLSIDQNGKLDVQRAEAALGT